LRKSRKLSIWKNFISKFAVPFDTILVKIVASHIDVSQKNGVNFEGLEVYLFYFLKKKGNEEF
jgi:hypothetical protein